MKIAFRVDASIQIGSGHLMRCLTLADFLRKKDLDIVFICREHDGHLCDFVKEKGYKIFRLPKLVDGTNNGPDSKPDHAHWLGCDWETDAEQTSVALSEEGPWKWLVVDHYALDYRWEKYLRPQVENIFVIDDLADRPHDCDALLDQNLYDQMESRYQELVQDTCEQFLGPLFAMLRPEFHSVRKTLHRNYDSVGRILIFFGGVDADNYTGLILEAFSEMKLDGVQVDVVLGASNPNQDAVRVACDAMENVHFHVQVEDMAELMGEADLAIGAGGVATWERCCLGLPAIVFPIADNQNEIVRVAAENGLLYSVKCKNFSSGEIKPHLYALLHNDSLRKHFSLRSSAMVDGYGAQRISEYLMKT